MSNNISRTPKGVMLWEGPEIVKITQPLKFHPKYWPAVVACWIARRFCHLMFYPDHFGHQCCDVSADILRIPGRKVYLASLVINKAIRRIHERYAWVIDIPPWLKQYLIEADYFTHCMSERISRGLASYSYTKEFTKENALAFSQEEKEYGELVLKCLGLKAGKYVAFHARDRRYGDKHHPAIFKDRGVERPQVTEDSKSQSFRNMDFADFLPTIEWLQSQGLTAVRMGADPECSYQANNLVDYASERHLLENPELADLYIMANAAWFIGHNTALQSLSMIFAIPSVCVNWFPYAPFAKPGGNVVICRNKKIKAKGIEFSEFDSRHLFDFMGWAQFYPTVEKEVDAVFNNSPEEILDTVKRAMQREKVKIAA